LKFEEKPDYQQLISMFREAFVREGFDFDFMYDWNVKKAALKQRLAEQNQKLQKEKLNDSTALQPISHKFSNTAQQ